MKCDGCTLCCKLLNIHWMDSPAGEWCKYCSPGKGCTVHTVAPDQCKDFECSYVQVDKASIDLRPDKCKVIFEKVAGDMFLGTLDPDYKLKREVKNQIDEFVRQGFSVVVLSGKNDPLIHSSGGKVAKVVYKEFQELAKRKSDTTIIHK